MGRFRTSARSEKKRVVGTSGRFKRAPIVGGGGGLALDDAPWPNSSAALKPSTSSMVMPESGLARLFVMKSEARERGPRDGGSGARRNSGRAKKRHSSVLKRCEAASALRLAVLGKHAPAKQIASVWRVFKTC